VSFDIFRFPAPVEKPKPAKAGDAPEQNPKLQSK
jgi:hypothetical protein